ncbi:MAG: energy-coupling factor transporter ATPase, partial [Chloroflexi bacterium]|nr:energy-coupling factor transporter ATPase [Chloroflexota bacterium]
MLTKAEEPLIRVEGLHYTYQAGTQRSIPALRGIDLTIAAGEYVAIIGANGSGKSTLLRHFNALLLPTMGDVWVRGWNTRDTTHLRDIRSTVGMVFQVPDDQIVASIVEEDVAFGPENLGVPEDELRQRVDWALAAVGLTDLRHRASRLLSAGQKQRLAIAAALAMQPHCLLLDEATAMLDPAGQKQVQEILHQLHDNGMTIVSATHNMAEAAQAQRVVVLSEGRIVMQGHPRSIFAQEETLRALQLDIPYPTRMAHRIAAVVRDFPTDVLTVTELAEALAVRLQQPLASR